ncbi:hypothetical protein QR685DRAFT_531854 [Neurospora intermedia]|uniref:Secreted protein n=1 Tax=Neurospora intermedia TaxID=5142 RepID=A0ABR3D5B7_NEUIN
MQGVDCRRVGWAARGPCAWFTLISRFQVSTAAPGLGPRQRRSSCREQRERKKCNLRRCNVLPRGTWRLAHHYHRRRLSCCPCSLAGWLVQSLVNSPKFTACVRVFGTSTTMVP